MWTLLLLLLLQLHKDGLIIKKPTVVHSRARVLARNEAKRNGPRNLCLHMCLP